MSKPVSKLRCALATCLLLGAPITALAVPITPIIQTDPGATYNTTGISEFNTGANDMNGLLITADFSDGSTQTATFSNGVAAATGFTVNFSGSTTFSDPWTVSVDNASASSITGLLFNGVPGDTIFDIVSVVENTPGSERGKAVTGVTGPTGLTLTALYSNRVTLNGVFYDDLYASLDLMFGGLSGGLGANDTLTFIADTDNTALAGDLTAVGVPEPPLVGLLGVGLLGLLGLRHRHSSN